VLFRSMKGGAGKTRQLEYIQQLQQARKYGRENAMPTALQAKEQAGKLYDFSQQRGLSSMADAMRQSQQGLSQNIARRGLGGSSVGLMAQANAQRPYLEQQTIAQAAAPMERYNALDEARLQNLQERQSRQQSALGIAGSAAGASPLATLKYKSGGWGSKLLKPIVGAGLTALTGGMGAPIGAALGGLGGKIGGGLVSGIGGMFKPKGTSWAGGNGYGTGLPSGSMYG
jgi:hypothetical protein